MPWTVWVVGAEVCKKTVSTKGACYSPTLQSMLICRKVSCFLDIWLDDIKTLLQPNGRLCLALSEGCLHPGMFHLLRAPGPVCHYLSAQDILSSSASSHECACSLSQGKKKHISINKCAGLSQDWVGVKKLFMCFFRVIPYGGEKHINKIPPKIPGQSRETSVYAFCSLCIFWAPIEDVCIDQQEASMTWCDPALPKNVTNHHVMWCF